MITVHPEGTKVSLDYVHNKTHEGRFFSGGAIKMDIELSGYHPNLQYTGVIYVYFYESGFWFDVRF